MINKQTIPPQNTQDKEKCSQKNIESKTGIIVILQVGIRAGM